jgi:hypothetical protein
MEPVAVAGDGLDLDRALQSSQPRQLLGDQERLEPPLGAELDVLEVAPAAAARSGVRAGGGGPVGGGHQDLDGVRPQIGRRAGGQACPDPFAGEGVADEDDLALRCPGHTATARRDGADLELQQSGLLRDGRRHGRGA